ncbi:MAG: hypothetical protein ACLFU2_13635, partial [Opitutales bacterium]
LDSLNDTGANELYIRREGLPGSRAADATYPGALQPDQTATVPTTEAGYYYIFIRSQGGPDSRVRLTTESVPFGITGVSPDVVGADAHVTMTVTGARFSPGATVKLTRPQFGEFVPVNYTVVDATEIVAVFDLRDAPLGLYDLSVINPDGSESVIPYRVYVASPEALEATVGLGGPAVLELSKGGFPNATYALSLLSLTNVDTPYLFFEYGVPRVFNDAAAIIPGERLDMQTNLRGAPGVDEVPWDDLESIVNRDGVLTASGFAYDFNTEGFAFLNFVLDIYPELDRLLEEDPRFLQELTDLELEALQFDFYIFAAVTPMTAEEYTDFQRERAAELRAAILADPDAPTNLRQAAASAQGFEDFYLSALREAGALRPQDAPPAATNTTQLFSDLAVQLAGLLGEGQAPADEDAFFALLRKWAGETPEAYGGAAPPELADYDLDLGSATRFEAFTIEVVVPDEFFSVAGFGSGGVGNVNDPTLGGLLAGDAARTPDLRLTGPRGHGDRNLIPVGYDLPYILNFANPASGEGLRELRIVQALDPALDMRSFRLGAIQLGDLTLPIPDGRGAFDGEFDLIDSHGFLLQVSAGMDIVEGIATWTLRAIDPETGLLIPEGARALLAPGEKALVSYVVRVRSDVPSGTGITAQARVFVDDRAPLDSALIEATIDSVAPTTDLTVTGGANGVHTLTWTASDDSEGSGVRDFSVFVSSDGWRYELLALRTTDTRYVHTTAPGANVTFLVRATDRAGNVEAPPDGASLPIFNPGIHLGALPQAPPVGLEPLPREAPPTLPATHPLFLEILGQIPGPTVATRSPDFTRVIDPFSAASFARGLGTSGAGVGALGVAVAPDGFVWVSAGAGRNALYRIPPGGNQTAMPLAVLDTPVYDLVFDRDGQLWATSGGGQLLLLDPANGQILERIGTGVTLGLAADPASSRLFVATAEGVQVFDTLSRRFSAFSTVRVEGLALSPEGELFGIRWPDGRELIRFDDRGRATEILTTDGQGVGLAFGAAGSRLEGLLFISQRDGTLTMVDV